MVAYLGSLHTGAAVTFANPMLTVAEFQRVLSGSRPTVAFAAGDLVEQLHELRRVGGPPHHVVKLAGGGAESLAAAVEGVAPIPARRGDPNEGGSSRVHLGHDRTSQAHTAHAPQLAGFHPSSHARMADVLVHALPLTHGHGLSGVQAVVISGCRTVLLPSFDPERLCDAVTEQRGTVLFSVPVIWERLLAWDSFARADLTSLRSQRVARPR